MKNKISKKDSKSKNLSSPNTHTHNSIQDKCVYKSIVYKIFIDEPTKLKKIGIHNY